jgi:DNA-binding NarL/FixJ family response regulator
MIRVLIADDHPFVRRGIKETLEDASDIEPTGEASTMAETIQAVRENQFDVVILDISMPDGSGLEALSQIKQLSRNPHVLILSMYPENQYAVRALRSGAAGYLTKSAAPDKLIQAIRKIAAGGRFVTPTLAEELARYLDKSRDAESHLNLSNREHQVMVLMAEGHTPKEIGAKLDISPKTVSTYRSRILDKLQLESTAEIIRYALERDLVK